MKTIHTEHIACCRRVSAISDPKTWQKHATSLYHVLCTMFARRTYQKTIHVVALCFTFKHGKNMAANMSNVLAVLLPYLREEHGRNLLSFSAIFLTYFPWKH